MLYYVVTSFKIHRILAKQNLIDIQNKYYLFIASWETCRNVQKYQYAPKALCLHYCRNVRGSHSVFATGVLLNQYSCPKNYTSSSIKCALSYKQICLPLSLGCTTGVLICELLRDCVSNNPLWLIWSLWVYPI